MPHDSVAPAKVGAIKVTIPLRASSFPHDVLPSDGAVPDVRMTLNLEDGGSLTAMFSGKNYRRAARAVRERLAAGEDPVVIVQGNLGPNGSLIVAGITLPQPRERAGA
jgi:hypothetical protein